jgi:hypothetical protein
MFQSQHTETGVAVMRAKANAITRMLQSVRLSLGDERMERFYIYMHTGNERFKLGVLSSRLNGENKLASDQRQQLTTLFRKMRLQLDAYQPSAQWAPADSSKFSEEEQSLIQAVNTDAYQHARLRKSVELHSALEREAARFLSPEQLDALKALNRESEQSDARYIEEIRPKWDSSKVDSLRTRLAQMPRYEAPKPISGRTKMELSVTIDNHDPVVITRELPNNAPSRFQLDDMTLEITPKMYRNGFTAETAFHALMAGSEWQLQQPTMTGSSKNGRYSQLSIVEGIRQAYLVNIEMRVVR